MGRRAPSRHRSHSRPVTPVSLVSDAITGSISSVGKGGLAVAVTTGVAATVAVPATAFAAGTPSSNTASMTALTVAPGEEALASTGAVTASESARVTFESGAFKAQPAAKTAERSVASTSEETAVPASSNGSTIVAIAARYVGVPYVYGGESPDGFDCSGYVQYVFKQAGISLPRTASQQHGATQRISASQAQPGDLVFFISGGNVYHDGIYAGDGMIYDAPKPGGKVSKRAIWTSSVVYGRP